MTKAMPGFLRFALGALIALAFGAPARAGDPTASAMVGGFHESLIGALKSVGGKGTEAREAAFAPVIAQAFDAQFMVHVAAGNAWDGFSDPERAQLTAAFRAFTVANYAARFRAYKGQAFEVLGEQPAPHDRVLVKARFVRRAGDAVALSYLVERMAGAALPGPRFAIVDVWFNNVVSELALRRSEFASVLRDKGFAGLIEQLRTRTAALARAETANGPQSQ